VRGERHLLRLGEYLVRRACQRLPRDTREERCREWTAELPAILHDPQVRFAPWRAVCMLGYAADTLRGTAMTLSRPATRRVAAFELLFLVVFLVAVVFSSWSIAQAPGDGQSYLQLAWSLLLGAYFIGRRVRAPARITSPLLFSAALDLEALNIWQAAQAPGDWAYYFWAASLGLLLLAALLAGLFPRLLARTRKA
jgi:hypothetical protein